MSYDKCGLWMAGEIKANSECNKKKTITWKKYKPREESTTTTTTKTAATDEGRREDEKKREQRQRPNEYFYTKPVKRTECAVCTVHASLPFLKASIRCCLARVIVSLIVSVYITTPFQSHIIALKITHKWNNDNNFIYYIDERVN